MSNQPQNPFANLPPGQTTSSPRKDRPINRFTPLGFTGTARELFGIQFVNILLTLLTVGIWIPWARVRKRRFFYNNTRILGDGLDYLATGFDLFKGWSVVVIILAGFYALPLLGVPFLQEGTSLALLAVYPWAINRSLRFNARNIVWRDVRFDFSGTYLGSAWYLFLLPFIGVLSLGILMPLASKGMREYVARNYRFGAARFSGKGQLGHYYGAGVRTLLLTLLLIGLVTVLSGLAIYSLLPIGLTMEDLLTNILANESTVTILYLVPVLLFVIFLSVGGFYRALTRNIMVNALRLQGGVRFRSQISGLALAWIIVSNLILSVITIGLLVPWAQVRQYRYLAQNTEIRPIADMQRFLDRQVQAGSSIGDAIGEAGGLEISF
ncbi:MAG TPA: hypothetical protein DD668_00675 [Alphaproteobacteria bacterium]|nr:hypothetical protein [Alphaproteobacteria bacterium]|tara:strand:+ start:1495 stop:2637 length:1143 start_codon:yes stop_codon:yes gene_type:complete